MTPRQITNDNTTARKAIASGAPIGAAQIARQAIQKRLHFDDFLVVSDSDTCSSNFLSRRLEIKSLSLLLEFQVRSLTPLRPLRLSLQNIL